MADDFEQRVGKLERNFETYMEILVQWLDELRTDMKEMRREHEARFAQNEERIAQNEERIAQNEDTVRRVVDVQTKVSTILQGMDQRLGNHEGRLAAGKL